jgi:hypothetical protein
MPLEISEIDIAMRVTSDSPGSSRDPAPPPAQAIDRKEIVEECVRRVLRELKARSEP